MQRHERYLSSPLYAKLLVLVQRANCGQNVETPQTSAMAAPSEDDEAVLPVSNDRPQHMHTAFRTSAQQLSYIQLCAPAAVVETQQLLVTSRSLMLHLQVRMLVSRRSGSKLGSSKSQAVSAAQSTDGNKANSSVPGKQRPPRATKKRKGGSVADRYPLFVVCTTCPC